MILATLCAISLLASMTQAQSNDLAIGSHISASSTSTTPPCNIYTCGPNQALFDIPANPTNPNQWVSQPSSCDPDWHTAGPGTISLVGRQNASLTLDWSVNYGTQLMTEVRFKYGSAVSNALAVEVVVFSEVPITVPVVAVPYVDGSGWYAFPFEVPVTASGVQLVWYGLQSGDGGKTCFVAVEEVQAWSGPPPDPLLTGNGGHGISSRTLAAAILVPIFAFLILFALGYWLVTKRRENLVKRFSTGSSDGITGFDALKLRINPSRARGERLVDDAEEPGSALSEGTTVYAGSPI
ncbi:hypothetical protein HDU98_006384 [Podochytrium sp. JEL0797]|nr:hypothetical protein HDU98_006384 [Podochytrium sp. JEL0797]